MLLTTIPLMIIIIILLHLIMMTPNMTVITVVTFKSINTYKSGSSSVHQSKRREDNAEIHFNHLLVFKVSLFLQSFSFRPQVFSFLVQSSTRMFRTLRRSCPSRSLHKSHSKVHILLTSLIIKSVAYNFEILQNGAKIDTKRGLIFPTFPK